MASPRTSKKRDCLEKQIKIILYQPVINNDYDKTWLHPDMVSRLTKQILKEVKKWTKADSKLLNSG